MTTYYVSQDGNDTNGGLSLEDAFLTLSHAITTANDDDTVMVNDGTWTGVSNRDLDLDGSVSVKSINGPEVCILDAEDSDYHFLINNYQGPTCIIDGFTLKNGSAVSGGSIYIKDDTGDPAPTIKNCIFEDNYASSDGGAIYMYHASPYFYNCVFKGNVADRDGGALKINAECLAGDWVAGRPYPKFINCTFYDNSAGVNGGVCEKVYNDVIFENCIFNSNSASGAGNEFRTELNANIYLKSCCHDDTTGYFSAGASGTFNADGSCITDDPLLDTDLSLTSSSPCIDAGENSYNSETYDIIGNDRIV